MEKLSNHEIKIIIKDMSDDELYKLFKNTIEEMNLRKETKEEGK